MKRLLMRGKKKKNLTFLFFRYEQQFICNLLLHLRCGKIDPDYVPEHGRGALSSSSSKKSSSHGHGGHHGHNRMQPSESSSGSGSNTGMNARKVSSKRESGKR